MGLVEISLERPRRYTPLKIEHAISLLEQEAANKYGTAGKQKTSFTPEMVRSNGFSCFQSQLHV